MRKKINIIFVISRYVSYGLPAVLMILFVQSGFAAPLTPDDEHAPVNDPFYVADSLAKIYQETDTAVIYRMLIRKAGWAEQNRRYKRAVKFYEQAAAMKPWADYPQERLAVARSRAADHIFYFIPNYDYEKSSILIKVLILIIIYSIISMIILLTIILFHRNRMEKEQKVRQVLKERYQLLLMDYLFNEEEHSSVPEKINKIAADNYNRGILMEEMEDLIVNLSGDFADSLRDLYYRLGLDKDSLRKAFSKKWHVKIKGFRELAFMNLKQANDEITRHLNSSNSILRMEAQLSLVRLNDENRFAFLDHIKRPFTKWEQMNVYEMIANYNLEVPEFQRWLNSANRTVVIFSLNMIKVFKQKNSSLHVIEMLENEDQEIRATAINVLGELKIKQSIPALKNHYRYEVYENQLAILVALNKISDESAAKFLVMVIDKEDDVQLQIEAAKALRNMGDTGQKALEKLMHSDYKNYMIIIKHVLDKRI